MVCVIRPDPGGECQCHQGEGPQPPGEGELKDEVKKDALFTPCVLNDVSDNQTYIYIYRDSKRFNFFFDECVFE